MNLHGPTFHPGIPGGDGDLDHVAASLHEHIQDLQGIGVGLPITWDQRDQGTFVVLPVDRQRIYPGDSPSKPPQ